MQSLSFQSISVDPVDLPILRGKDIRLEVLRLDKIHSDISGNTWFKLKYYLQRARDDHKNCILTYGGAYSNHLLATAAAGKLLGFKTKGIVRGEAAIDLSPVLRQATDYGMELFFITRSDYLQHKLPAGIGEKDKTLAINEGGYGIEGAMGASEMLRFCEKERYSHIACAVGSSTMMAGLIKAASPHQEIAGISVLRNNTGLNQDLHQLLTAEDRRKKFRIIHDYHFGGYAKHNKLLLNFMNELYASCQIPSDFVYTGKLFFAVSDMISNNYFPAGSNILVIHSGGLLGNSSLVKGQLIF